MNVKLRELFPNINSEKLIKYILRETGQDKDEAVNIDPILDLLKLNHLHINIPTEELELPPDDRFRALLYYPEKIVATESGLSSEVSRFSIFHEIAHYVLPSHQDTFFLCLESDMSDTSIRQWEKEANKFAAEIMFHGESFSKIANEISISAKTIKILKDRFKNSIEATARHLIEKTLKPVLLVVYEEKNITNNDIAIDKQWDVKYCIASSEFRRIYGVELRGDPENPKVKELGKKYRDIGDSIKDEVIFDLPNKGKILFKNEYFTNTYNVFRIMIPKKIG